MSNLLLFKFALLCFLFCDFFVTFKLLNDSLTYLFLRWDDYLFFGSVLFALLQCV
jgi:hypothetical protein